MNVVEKINQTQNVLDVWGKIPSSDRIMLNIHGKKMIVRYKQEAADVKHQLPNFLVQYLKHF